MCSSDLEEGGMSGAEQLLKDHPDITALFALNDKMALGALRKLNELGIRCPDDVAVVGFDDIPAASFTIPALTTVHQPLYELGKMACDRLVELIHGKTERVQEVVPIHLVVRESCGAKKQQAVEAKL